MTVAGQDNFLHFYICDVPCCALSVGKHFKTLRQGYSVQLSSEEHALLSPRGSRIPVERHGSLVFPRPTLLRLNQQKFEQVCNLLTVSLDDLADERTTFLQYEDGAKETLVDNWCEVENPHEKLLQRFVGKTAFKLKSVPAGRRAFSNTSTLPEPQPLQQPERREPQQHPKKKRSGKLVSRTLFASALRKLQQELWKS